MKLWFTIIATLIISVFVQAQAFQIDKLPLPIDSLRKVLPFLRDIARVDCVNELARSYAEAMTQELSDSAWSIARQAHEEAAAINYINGLGDANIRFGRCAQW